MNYKSQYTGQQIDEAVGKAHEHSNKAVLDAINSIKIAEWDGKADLANIPTKTSDLTNDSDFQNSTEVSSAITSAINGLNKSGSPSTNQYISIVRQSAGIIECQKATLPMHTAGNGIQVSSGTVSAKLGSGLSFDANGAIQATGGGASWGSITGTLSSQTDLQSALDAKANSSAIPTKVSDLTNDSGFITSSDLSGYQTAIPNVPSGATTGKFASAVSQTNGQISVTYQGMDRLANSNQAFTDDDYVVRGTSTGAFQKSRFSLVWDYIKSKITTWCGIADDNQPVCSGNSTKLTIVKVAELPASPDPNTIYLISE